MPVLPDVPSTIVPPGLIFPCFSAASSIVMPIRSFTLPPGFIYSSFASTVARTPRTTRLSLTSGVLPMTSRMFLCHTVLRYHTRFDPAERLRRGRHRQVADIYVLDAALQKSKNTPRADLFRVNACGEIALQI